MIYQEAMIKVIPGKVGEFIDICENEYRPAAQKLGKKLVAQWRTIIGPSYEVIDLWTHDDIADLKRFQEAREQSEECLKAMRKLWSLTIDVNTKLLIPTPHSSLK